MSHLLQQLAETIDEGGLREVFLTAITVRSILELSVVI